MMGGQGGLGGAGAGRGEPVPVMCTSSSENCCMKTPARGAVEDRKATAMPGLIKAGVGSKS